MNSRGLELGGPICPWVICKSCLASPHRSKVSGRGCPGSHGVRLGHSYPIRLQPRGGLCLTRHPPGGVRAKAGLLSLPHGRLSSPHCRAGSGLLCEKGSVAEEEVLYFRRERFAALCPSGKHAFAGDAFEGFFVFVCLK